MQYSFAFFLSQSVHNRWILTSRCLPWETLSTRRLNLVKEKEILSFLTATVSSPECCKNLSEEIISLQCSCPFNNNFIYIHIHWYHRFFLLRLASLSPAACNFKETLSTLKYANRAKAIKVLRTYTIYPGILCILLMLKIDLFKILLNDKLSFNNNILYIHLNII